MTAPRGIGQSPLTIDHREVERRKQSRRDLWDYRPVDHIPIAFWPTWTFGYTPREATESGDIDDSWSDEEVTSLYWDMRRISNEYAASMRWAS